jgi:hypothetical protein
MTTGDPMPTFESSTSSSSDAIVARHAARLDACWPRVHVDSAQVLPTPSGRRVTAVVALGGLVPADVRVELVSSKAIPGSSPLVHERMTCDHALGNGAFVFELTLPRHEGAAPSEWLIHVHPVEALVRLRIEHSFRSAG